MSASFKYTVNRVPSRMFELAADTNGQAFAEPTTTTNDDGDEFRVTQLTH